MEPPSNPQPEEPHTNIIQVDSNLDVTHKLTAPTTFLGDEICNIELRSDTEHGERLLITLPTTGKGQPEPGQTQTYDMRSIIESIQELNRRTATFNCNVSFNAALEAYDVSKSPNANFACDLDEDGLPAASNGSSNIPPLTEENKYRVLLCINHEPIANLHEDTGLVIDLTNTDKNSVDVSNDPAILGYISSYNDKNNDKITYLEAYPNIHGYDESTRTVVVKVLTQSYFNNTNKLWEYSYRTWRGENTHERAACPGDNERFDYTKLSARYNYSLTSNEYIGNIYNTPMTSLVRTSAEDDNPANLPDGKVHVAECIYQFAPIEVSETPTEITDTTGTYDTYDIVIDNSNLKTIDLRYHDTSRVMYMTGMFQHNESVTDIKIPDTFNTSNVIDFVLMFAYAMSIRRLILPESFDTSKAISLYKMFHETPQLSTISFNESFDTSMVKIMRRMFYCCGVRGLLTLPSKFTAVSVKRTGMAGLFAHMINCDSIIFPPDFEVGSNVTSYWEVFGYSSFRYLTIPSSFIPNEFNLSAVPDFTQVFRENSLLTQLFLPDNFELASFYPITGCFYKLSSLSLIYIGNSSNASILTDDNETGLLLNDDWSQVASHLYTRNLKNISINCDLVKRNNTMDFSNTLDIRYYPIRPGCNITLIGHTIPYSEGELPTIPITLLSGTTTYDTHFDLTEFDGPGELPVKITFSDEYDSMTITSTPASYNGTAWYLRWVFIIKIDYTQ